MPTRREFLSLLGMTAAAAALSPALGFAQSGWLGSGEGYDGEPLPPPDSAELREQEKTRKKPYVDGLLYLHSAHTGERYQFPFRDGYGNYDAQIMQQLNWFLRCHYDNEYIAMNYRVIEMLNYTAQLLGNPVITINSGYRTPRYNAILARSNENVAKNSFHMRGMAIDFCIPGIPIRRVCQYAQLSRNIAGNGGIGYYPRQGFVHIDSGDRAANWVR